MKRQKQSQIFLRGEDDKMRNEVSKLYGVSVRDRKVFSE